MTTNAPEPVARSAQRAGRYLTFRLSHESYGIMVTKIREIIRYTEVTPMPQMPSYVLGVINLRGKIIPVIDLRARFGMAMAQTTERTCIIVVQTNGATAADQAKGLLVDDVEEVTNLSPTEIEDTPDFGSQVDVSYLVGIAKVKGGVKTLLDIDLVLAAV